MDIKQFTPIIAYGVFMASAVLHEAAHGYMAYRFGDHTAKEQGRLSLNPLKHMDTMGSVMIPIVMFVLTASMFGWAKPVPVDFDRMGKKQQFLISGAGLGVNLFLSLMGLLLFYATNQYMTEDAFIGTQIVCAGVFLLFPVNLILALFNMIPLPPLDGWMMVSSFLDKKVNQNIIKKPWISVIGLGLAIMIIGLMVGSIAEFIRDLSIARIAR